MSDALFENQAEHRPVEELAQRVGLDLPRFKACLTSPEAAQRLASDVAAGVAAGVPATPTYVVNGVAYPGEIPTPALPPPRSASR